MQKILRYLLKVLYRIEVSGLENLDKSGARALIVANHQSFLDAALLALFLPGRPMFAVNTFIAKEWWIKPFLKLANVFPLDPTNPMATKALIAELKKGGKAVIFPEGRITVTGSLMKVYEGPGMIADKSGAAIIPVRIEGAQYTPMSRLKGKVRLRWFPKLTIKILTPRTLDVDQELQGRSRRAMMGDKLYDIMTKMIFESSDSQKTLFQSLIDARAIHGGSHKIVVDVERSPLNYNQIIRKSLILGSYFLNKTRTGEYVGILLPNMASTIVTFFSLQAIGRVPAMLNFSTGLKNILLSCDNAVIKTVITSRRFIEKARLSFMIDALAEKGIDVLYLEDIVQAIPFKRKLRGVVASFFAQTFYDALNKRTPDDAAVVLFTSGSEGAPKGVVLSHLNIQSNRYQMSSCIDFGPQDKIFNALPVFHSFGLTAGALLPILSGVQTFFYPSPLHYRIVPELIYDTNSTIMFGTDTFLSGYARFAHPYDFYSLRYVFSGAEKLKDETRRIYSEKYGVRIFEGYGATETAPVLAMNTPMHYKPGTVGRLMPGIETKLEQVPGIDDGFRLFVRGPNIMKGYLLTENPGKIVPPIDGWYDTGDIVAVDEKGYITIKGRAKRFAKIAGEMVSLSVSEALVNEVYPGCQHAVVAISDPKKGEALVLVTSAVDIQGDLLVKHAKELGLSELSIPRKIKHVESVPVLGTGKTDYIAVQKIANDGVPA